MDCSEVTQKIRSGNMQQHDLEGLIRDELSLPLETIMTGLYFSKYLQKRDHSTSTYARFQYDPNRTYSWIWLHMLVYCSDKQDAIDFLDEIIMKYPHALGDAICVYWMLNRDKAVELLKLVHTYDPNYESIRLVFSPYITKIHESNPSNAGEVFMRLYVTAMQAGEDDEADTYFQSLLIKPSDNMGSQQSNSYPNINRERTTIIEIGNLTETQADKLLQFLATFVVRKSPLHREYSKRLLTDYFEFYQDEDVGPQIKYRQETRQFIRLLEYVSEETYMDIVPTLMDSTSFWLDTEINRIVSIRSPDLFLEKWVDFLKDLGNIHKKSQRSHNIKLIRSRKGNISVALKSLYQIARNDPEKMTKLKEACIALIPHREPTIQILVQNILQDNLEVSDEDYWSNQHLKRSGI